MGLTILGLLAAGVVALAGNGLGGRNSETRGSCPVAAGDPLCEADDDGDGILNFEDSDWICPADGSSCGEGAGTCEGLSANRPLDGTGFGAKCGGGMGRSVGGCNGGRF
ncbi:hypothetical protein ACFLSZ_04325 [Candidatus Bipolaricaulota bacterium]